MKTSLKNKAMYRYAIYEVVVAPNLAIKGSTVAVTM